MHAEQLNRMLIEEPVHGLAENLRLDRFCDARMRAHATGRRWSGTEET